MPEPSERPVGGRNPLWTLSAGVGASWVILFLHLVLRPLLPIRPLENCPSISLFSLPCPFCGGTRASLAFFHGHFRDALGWSPLAFLTLLGLCLATLLLPVLWLRPPRKWPRWPVGKPLLLLFLLQFLYQVLLNPRF